MFVGKQTHVHRVDREICDYFGLDVMKEYVIVATEMFRMQKIQPGDNDLFADVDNAFYRCLNLIDT